jgi:hypothetical protein
MSCRWGRPCGSTPKPTMQSSCVGRTRPRSTGSQLFILSQRGGHPTVPPSLSQPPPRARDDQSWDCKRDRQGPVISRERPCQNESLRRNGNDDPSHAPECIKLIFRKDHRTASRVRVGFGNSVKQALSDLTVARHILLRRRQSSDGEFLQPVATVTYFNSPLSRAQRRRRSRPSPRRCPTRRVSLSTTGRSQTRRSRRTRRPRLRGRSLLPRLRME